MKSNKVIVSLYDKKHYLPVNAQRKLLISFFIDNYIPYIECHRKCPKSISCKHTSLLKNDYSDQKCVLLKNIVSNFFMVTFPIYKKLTKKDKQLFLNTCIEYFDLMYDLEFEIGTLENKWVLRYFKLGAPSFIGTILNERRRMEKIAFQLRKIKSFRSKMNVYLVEGLCDQIILNSIAFCGIANFNFLKNNIDTIGGKDKIKKGRLDLLINNKLSRNERTILILDGDGEPKKNKISNLKKYWNSKPKLIRKKDIYIFKNTIESAFPTPILLYILKKYCKKYANKSIQIKEKDIEGIIKMGGDIIKKFEIKYLININKKIFDSMLGDFLSYIVPKYYSNCMIGERPFDAEIFRFLKFLEKSAYN